MTKRPSRHRTVLFALRHATIATTLAVMMVPAAASAQQASSRGMTGNMNLMRLLNRIKALERTTSILSKQNAHLLTCQEKLMTYSPSSKQADSDGCAATNNDLQIGSLVDTTAHASRTRKVVFKSPFNTAPKVVVAMQGYTFSGPCRNDYFHFEPKATNITRTGFTVVLQGKSSGCAKSGIEGIVWMASTKLSETVVAAPPPLAPSVPSSPAKPRQQGCRFNELAGGTCR